MLEAKDCGMEYLQGKLVSLWGVCSWFLTPGNTYPALELWPVQSRQDYHEL